MNISTAGKVTATQVKSALKNNMLTTHLSHERQNRNGVRVSSQSRLADEGPIPMFETQPPLVLPAAKTVYGTSLSPYAPKRTGLQSRSLHNVRQKSVAAGRVRRHHPITLKQLDDDEHLYERNEKSLENAMFAVSNIRKPYHMLDSWTKKQLEHTVEKYKRIDDKFLDEKIRPRIIVFMEDGTNLSSLQKDRMLEVPAYEKKGPNNVVLNVSKFMAKYDFEIASKLKHAD